MVLSADWRNGENGGKKIEICGDKEKRRIKSRGTESDICTHDDAEFGSHGVNSEDLWIQANQHPIFFIHIISLADF